MIGSAPVTFSFRQGDPLPLLLFVIQQEPLLWQLHQQLPSSLVSDEVVKEESYVDDVDTTVYYFQTIDTVCCHFEAMSGQILNRNCKSAVLGLGEKYHSEIGRSEIGRSEIGRSEIGRSEIRQCTDWLLTWLISPPTLKVFRVTPGASL
jgi:hypothetical protein